VLLLDEPTASVDEASAGLIREAVCRSVIDAGTTVVVATHDTDWLCGVLPAQIVTLRGGRIVQTQ
jgi:tungstate transport system ATP-binding protein